METTNFEEWLKGYRNAFAPVVPYAEGDRFLRMDFTAANRELTDEILKDTTLFTQWVNGKLKEAGARYGVGGYNENRTIYRRSAVFEPSLVTTPAGHGGAVTPSRLELEDELLNAQGPYPDLPPLGEGHQPHNTSPVEEADVYEEEFYWTADVDAYKALKVFVAQHRKNPTKAEELLWQRLRREQLGGYRFRRQHVIGHYIADFVCLAKKLVVEVDGLHHQLPENQASDEERTFWLNQKGYTVVRFTNEDVISRTEQILSKIQNTLATLPFAEKRTYPRKAEALTSEERSVGGLPPLGASERSEGWERSSRDRGPEARSVHLGLDIWGPPHTRVTAPLDGIVHSFAFNNAFGDYGATIILTHNLEGETFHTLYGHLSLNSLKNLHEGQNVFKGDAFAEFGLPFENGQWPPHLHFQIIRDMEGMKGDYPGVCAPSEREKYLANCPDADAILGLMAKTV